MQLQNDCGFWSVDIAMQERETMRDALLLIFRHRVSALQMSICHDRNDSNQAKAPLAFPYV